MISGDKEKSVHEKMGPGKIGAGKIGTWKKRDRTEWDSSWQQAPGYEGVIEKNGLVGGVRSWLVAEGNGLT